MLRLSVLLDLSVDGFFTRAHCIRSNYRTIVGAPLIELTYEWLEVLNKRIYEF